MKKGYTIVELIAVLGIFTVIYSFTFLNAVGIRGQTRQREFDGICLHFLFDIRSAKLYAQRGSPIKVNFLKDSYEIINTKTRKTIKKVKFPSYISIDYNNSTLPELKSIYFDPEGSVLPRPCSIALSNGKSVKIISIKVGTNTIDFKKDT